MSRADQGRPALAHVLSEAPPGVLAVQGEKQAAATAAAPRPASVDRALLPLCG
jgi:hypothetical protein